MGVELQENEFWGEIDRFCEDREKIYFYDEMTCGLFYMDKNTYEIGLLMSPDEFTLCGDFPVLQLIKSNDNLYIIPMNMKFGWRIFNLTSRHMDIIFPFKKDEIIGNDVVKIKNIIYIIPGHTNQVFAKFDILTGMAKVISDNWFDGDKTKACWGCSEYLNEIVFPIIGTNEIVRFKDEKIEKIKLPINERITSVCIDSDGLWILPELGNYIYIDNGESEISKIIITRQGIFVSDFIRIVSERNYLILFPKADGNILIYKKKEKKWVCIEKSKGNRFRALFRQLEIKTIPFWGYSFCSKKILFMPRRYRLAEMNLDTWEMEFKTMICGKGFTGEKYKEWVKHNHLRNRKTFLEGTSGTLEDLINYIDI